MTLTFENCFSVRTYEVLSKNGIKTFEGILLTTPDKLLKTKFCGRKTLVEISMVLQELGFSLPEVWIQQFLKKPKKELIEIEVQELMKLWTHEELAHKLATTRRFFAALQVKK